MSNIPPPQDPNFSYEAPPQSAQKSNLGWIIAAIFGVGFCLCLPIAGAILFPVFPQAKLAAKKSDALSKIKQSGTSLLIYTADFDDKFPPNMGDSDALKSSLSEYLNDNGLTWTILETPTQGNPNLSGETTFELKMPNATVMLYCIPDGLQPKAVVAAADSSAKAVDATALELEITSNKYQVPGN